MWLQHRNTVESFHVIWLKRLSANTSLQIQQQKAFCCLNAIVIFSKLVVKHKLCCPVQNIIILKYYEKSSCLPSFLFLLLCLYGLTLKPTLPLFAFFAQHFANIIYSPFSLPLFFSTWYLCSFFSVDSLTSQSVQLSSFYSLTERDHNCHGDCIDHLIM